ncbi:hypothetical protein O3M35_006046 [Rhynocoris fuscipes]|uniref:EF-hand domain-containing protein n=1 Tax=Rhynocoris fuscipes TaxID=488301 RepID=A0AAW1DBW9_9HEMI
MFLQRFIKPRILQKPYNLIFVKNVSGVETNFPEEDVRNFKILYDKYDCMEKNSLDRWEFNNFVRGTMGRRLGAVDLHRIFLFIDKNKDALIQFEEILDHFEKRLVPQPESDVKQAFSIFDKDKNNRLTLYETRMALLYLGEDYGNLNVRGIFIGLDQDNDGEINFGDFKKLLENLKESHCRPTKQCK